MRCDMYASSIHLRFGGVYVLLDVAQKCHTAADPMIWVSVLRCPQHYLSNVGQVSTPWLLVHWALVHLTSVWRCCGVADSGNENDWHGLKQNLKVKKNKQN